jgi:hypothetical protein
MKRVLKIAAMISILANAAFSQQPASAGFEGTIIKFGTGEPISKVRVELQGGSETQATTTEPDGKFYFPNLPPGTYRITARRDGYWPAEFGQTWVSGPGQPITLAADQKIRNIEIVMTKGAVISGRITDRVGRPLVGARVRAMKPWIQENQRILRVVQEVVANDLGEYRLIWLLPGRYYLSATFVDFPAGTQLVINPDAPNAGVNANASRSVSRQVTSGPMNNGIAEDEVYAPVYFPGTADSDKSIAVELRQGEEYRDADINLVPTRTFHVRGLVTDMPAPGTPPGGPQPAPGPFGGQTPVRLAPQTPNGSLYATPVEPSTGRFDFPKVVTGAYVSYLFLNGNTIRSSIEVRSGDVDGVFLPVTAGVDIPVRIRFEGELPKNFPSLSNLRPTLWREPTLMNAPAMPSTFAASLVPGTAEAFLQNIAPGDYRIYVPPLMPPLNGANPVAQQPGWQGAYIKSIRLGETDVLNASLRFRSPPPVPLDIVVAANPGVLTGRVFNENRELVPSAVVTVLADTPSERLYRTDMYRVTSTDTSGRFELKGLPPGDYKIFAWENVENAAWMDPTFLDSYERRGRTLHIDEGQTSSIDLSVIVGR